MRFIILIAVVLGVYFPLNAAEHPLDIYGEKIEFDVVRDDKIVGQHSTRFNIDGNSLIVNSTMNIDIKFLNISFYNFDYASREIWQANLLQSLDVVVNDDNEIQRISAVKNDGVLQISSNEQSYETTEALYTTNHWAFDVTNQNKVLNTLTGNINNVTVTDRGIETIRTATGKLLANRYDYSGELKDTSAWYDEKGRWVKLMFKGRDGSTIEYICRRCDKVPPS